MCAALVSGDIGQATEDFSPQLRQNLGEVIALLPLPATEATVVSIDRGGGTSYAVVLRLVSETEEVQIQTRWKDRDGRPTVIEASHLSRTEMLAQSGETPGPGDAGEDETAAG
jgi:hypothetical protein